jgi:hypothetical protein
MTRFQRGATLQAAHLHRCARVRRGVWTTGFSARASFLDSVHTLFVFGAADPFSQDFCSELRYRRLKAILLIRMLAYFDGAS